MKEFTLALRDALFDAGYAARKAEKPRASACCDTFMKLVNSQGILEPREFNELCWEWYEGYTACEDEIVAKIFDDDEYFQAKVTSNRRTREARLSALGV
jgi:hypothetical protein